MSLIKGISSQINQGLCRQTTPNIGTKAKVQALKNTLLTSGKFILNIYSCFPLNKYLSNTYYVLGRDLDVLETYEVITCEHYFFSPLSPHLQPYHPHLIFAPSVTSGE